MATPTPPHSPERQQQLARLKLLWLFVAEELDTWPDALKATTRLAEDLGLRGAEGHRFAQRFAEAFGGAALDAAAHFGPPPADMRWALRDALLRRLLSWLKRWGLYPAPLAVRGPGQAPLSLADLGARVLAGPQPSPTALAEAERLHTALAHDLQHWARHLERPPRAGLGGVLGLLNRSRALTGES